MAENKVALIDLQQIIDSRAKGRRVPSFLIRWIKNFVHEEFLNNYFRQGRLGYDFATGALEYLDVPVTVHGLENIPAEGKFAFVSNHPLGGIDALAIISVLGIHYQGKIRFLANDILASLTQLSEYLVPVNKLGSNRQSSSLSTGTNDIYASDNQIIWFPAGKCSRRYNGKIQDPAWRKTFVTKSRQYGRDVIPVWMSGRNSRRFYFIDQLCRFLRIKTNFAMFCLPDELYRGQHKPITVNIGKPIPWQTFTSDRKDQDWAAWVRDKAYELSE